VSPRVLAREAGFPNPAPGLTACGEISTGQRQAGANARCGEDAILFPIVYGPTKEAAEKSIAREIPALSG